MLDQLHNGD